MMLYIEALKLDLVGVNVCFATLFAGLLYYLLIAPIVNGPLSHLSGPILCKLSRYYLSYYDITLQRTHKVHEWHIKYGPVICIGPGEVSVATPELMREIYGSSGKYAKSQFFDHFVAWGERALFAIRPYAAHQQKRKLMSAFYHNINKPAVEAFIQERVTAVVKQIDKRQDETPSLDIFPMASHFAFDNISRLLHGHLYCTYTVEKDCEERRILTGLKDAQLWGPFKFDFPWIYNHIHGSLTLLNRLPYSLKADDDLMYWSYNRVTEIIADQKVVDGEEDILLCRLLNTKELDGSPLNLNYVHSELYDNLNAAQVTVAVTFTYIIYHLSGNSIWQRRIRVELLSLPCETTGLPSFASVNAAPLLNAFIREVYRMNPGTGGHAERVVPNGGKTYDGIYVPGGTRITASTIALHQNASVFPAPEVFDPTRWLGKTPEELRILESSFIPFGFGARVCLGKLFATMEIKLLIARLYTQYTTKVDSSKTMKESMWQCATHDAVPRGLRCDVVFTPLGKELPKEISG